MIRWLSSVPGSFSVTVTCTLLTCAILLPRAGITPQPLAPIAQAADPSDRPRVARPVTLVERTISGVPIRLVTIALSDPQTFINIGLANEAIQANSARSTRGDEAFESMVKRHRAAITASGTFFSMDGQKRVMGNMVAAGRFVKYSPWENYGTTLGLKRGTQLEMVTARTEGKPKWDQHWFSLTAGPRLLKQGKISIHPKQEGFSDPAVMGVATRSAIGFPKSANRLYLVTFHKPITLRKEAEIMRAIGAHEAMNLDGGTSVALASGKRVLQPAGRELTNVITVYDSRFPAPEALKRSWATFQRDNQVALQFTK
ncbi:MAG: phosphodiester glycosidase family protein [Leptolyngbya sp. Prado105]|nr:phosphodiester glycosidase family protein [Leptolyngbya sp. Prado105]